MRRLRLFLSLLALSLAGAGSAQAQDIPEAVTAVPEGTYVCVNADPAAPRRDVLIENETNYALFMKDGEEQIPGLYEFRGGRLRWTSGPLRGRQPGVYEVDGLQRPFRMRLTVWDESPTPYHCRLPPPKPPNPSP